jgi:DNA topoisomerase-1
MQVAQRLYEGVDIGGEMVGLITYMRTDGVQIVPEAVSEIRRVIEAEYGKRYTPFAREYKSKAKNAQEAHEAIRPTDPSRRPDQVARYLEKDQAALYELIWLRTIASQMASAELEQTTAEITVKGKDGKTYGLRATGSVVVFDGFMRLYSEGRDDEEEEDSRRLPPLERGDTLRDKAVTASQHFTEPPPRYTEATLVKRMEELGIGRPSTYATTLAVLRDRGYVRLERKRLVPEDKGRLVTAFLESFFRRYVEFDFTADLEEKLDLISDGKLEWKDVLREFWRDFTAAVDDIKDLRVSEVLEALNEILGPHIFPPKADGGDPRACPVCGSGRLSLKIGRFGAFIGCSNYPECRYTRQFTEPQGAETETTPPEGKLLGYDPDTGLPVTLRSGRFGPYVQLGEAENGEKPKRASIPRGMDAATIDLERALQLLALPREVGLHPESGKPITAGIGRYGPFVLHDGTYANLESLEDVFTIGINRAVTLLAEKAAGGKGKWQRPKAEVLKDLGEHPEGGKIEVLSGRYGPYVKHGSINATLPKGKDPLALTREEALDLLAAREGQNGTGRKRGKAKASTKKAAEKSAPEKAAANSGAVKKATKTRSSKARQTEPAAE